MTDTPMTRNPAARRRAGRAALAAALAALSLAGGLAGGTAHAGSFVVQRALRLDTALTVAQAVLAACRAQDWQASVGVVDQYGNVRVVLRDELAGPHTATSAVGKAHTALVSAGSTLALAERTQAGREESGMRFLPGTIYEGGGELIRIGGEIVGAVGVGGAPGPHADVRCAVDGLAAVQASLGLDAQPLRQRSLTFENALALAETVMAACRRQDWNVSVAVVDRGGSLQALLRDSRAGARTGEAAMRKAYTALSYRTSSQDMAELTQAGLDPSGMRFVPGSLHVGGGERIWAHGENVGAVAVAGAPTPAVDVRCATEGLDEFAVQLDLESP